MLVLTRARLSKGRLRHDDDPVSRELCAPPQIEIGPLLLERPIEAAEVRVDVAAQEHAVRAHGEDVRPLVVLALVCLSGLRRVDPATGPRRLDAERDEQAWVVPVDDLGTRDTGRR